MIYFDLLMTLIENLIFTYFTFKILKLDHKLYFILSNILCFCTTVFFNSVYINNFLAAIFLVIIQVGIVFAIKKAINLYQFIIPVVLISLLLVSSTVSLFIMLIFYNFDLQFIIEHTYTFVILASFSKIIFIVLGYIFMKVERKYFGDKIFINNEWIVFTIFSFALLEIYTILSESIFYLSIDTHTIYQLLLFVIILMFSFFILFFKIQKDYYNYLIVNNELIKSKYYGESYNKLNTLSYQISQDKHDMFYALLSIKNQINDEKVDDKEVVEFIDKQLDKIQVYNNTPTTIHSNLDVHLFSCFDQLKEENYDIKSIISVKDEKYVDNQELIEMIKDYTKIVVEHSKNKEINFQLYENKTFLILKISTEANKNSISLQDLNKKKYVRKIKLNEKSEKEIELNVLFHEDL